MPQFTPTLPRVSVLMATHDAEGCVRRAVESLQNQTLRDFELIVVDADSQDATQRLLRALAERDLRIEVVQAGACGRQDALDLALERARGRYLAVMDADGWARPTMLADLVGLAEERSLELVVGGVSLTVSLAGGRPSETSVESERAVFPSQHDFRTAAWELFSSGQLLPASAKLFLRERAVELGARFSSELASDHAFVISYLRDVERVGVLEGTCYHLDRSFAQMAPGRAGIEGFRRLEAEHDALLDLYRHWGLDGDAASVEMLQSRYMERLVGCVEVLCGRGGSASSAEQRQIVGRMIGTDRAQLAASVARPRSNGARSLLAPIRSQNSSLVCVQARLLALLRRGRIVETLPDAYL